MNKIIKILTLILLLSLSLSSFAGCNKDKDAVKEIPPAEFSNQTKMFKQEGFSIIMDVNFSYDIMSDCPISASNGDLTFEAFYFEKYYFLEKDNSISTPKKALAFVNKDKTVSENKLGLPFVEYTKDGSDGVNYTFYYVCIDDAERYWMCTFFSPTSSFDGYREHIMDYLSTIDAVYEEKQ